jgi:antitoxin MazE
VLIKYLTKHGNSLALLIDKPILELLDISPESPLLISTDGKKLTITPSQRPEGETQNRKETETENEEKRS